MLGPFPFDKPVPKGVSPSLKRHGRGRGQEWQRLIKSLTSSWQLMRAMGRRQPLHGSVIEKSNSDNYVPDVLLA